MKSVKIAILAGSLSLLAWSQGMPQSNAETATPTAQQPAAQPNAAPQSTTSASATSPGALSVSGCMQESWGRFLVANGGTTYDVKGSGTSLSNHVNRVVQVHGLPDTKSAQGNTIPLYAQQVQDTGQTCGANAQNATPGVQPGTAQPGTTAASGATSTGTQPAAGAAATQPGAPASTGEPTEAQPGQTPQTASPQTGTSPQAAAGQTGSAATDRMQPGGSAEIANQPNEAKGTPTEGTPSPAAVAAPAGSAASAPGSESASAAPAQQANLNTFRGCLSGKDNQYEYKSNGKTYRLQGNTTMLHGLTGHQVEITGEDFNGKAIQVNGARDLGSSCSK